jgi:uncharacterized membrane protein HdeD (DUF308 family)
MPADESTLLSGDGSSSTPAPAGDRPTDGAAFLMYYETPEEISQNYKTLIFIGCINILFGTGCLMFPVFATELAELFLTSLVFATGLLNVLTICASERSNSHEKHLFWIGVTQLVLAFLMYTRPFFTLTILTFLVAITFMFMGSLQIAAARKYRNVVAARGLMIVSGVSAILMSVVILLSMPTAKWLTIGVLMGVNLLNIGLNRVVMGLYGRRIAVLSDEEIESWRSYLDADFSS